ncbi:MAG: zinc ribbon domain-containing protein [Pyrobaculum sp.]
MNCSYCGAPLDLTPESVVVVCRYCGTPNFVAGNPSKILAVPTLSSSEVLRRAVERTKRDFNLGRRMSEINFASPDLIYLPFYFVDVRLRASYEATVVLTYTRTVYVRGQATTRVETKRVRVSGVVTYSDLVAVLARRAAWGLSVDKLTSHFFKTAPEPRQLAEVATSTSVSGAFLAAELTPERAKAKAVRAVVPRLLARVDEDAARVAREETGLLMASATVEDRTVDYTAERLEVSPLTYLPMWVVPYLYKGSYYNYYVAGWDGAVVVAEEPSFVENKAISLLGVAAAGGVLGGLSSLALLGSFVEGAMAALLGTVATYILAGGLLKSRRVEA